MAQRASKHEVRLQAGLLLKLGWHYITLHVLKTYQYTRPDAGRDGLRAGVGALLQGRLNFISRRVTLRWMRRVSEEPEELFHGGKVSRRDGSFQRKTLVSSHILD